MKLNIGHLISILNLFDLKLDLFNLRILAEVFSGHVKTQGAEFSFSWHRDYQIIPDPSKLLETSEITERITGSFVSWLHHRVLLSKRLLAICADMMNIMYIPWRSVMYLHLLDFACVRPENTQMI